MPFADLDSVNLKDYIINEREDARLWLFMHIPKTAGSSFSDSVRKLIRPYANIEADYTDNTKSHNAKIAAATDEFIRNHDRHKIRSASGHLPYELVEKIKKAVKGTKTVTFLRDPVSRIISDFRYQRTPEHPLHKEFADQFPTIESYISSKDSQNKIALFIGGQEEALEKNKLLTRINDEFSFVGLLEMYPMSYNIMFDLFGVGDQFPQTHVRKTPDTAATKVNITDSIVGLIKEANELDFHIYNHVHERLLRIRDAWSACLEEFSAEGMPT